MVLSFAIEVAVKLVSESIQNTDSRYRVHSNTTLESLLSEYGERLLSYPKVRFSMIPAELSYPEG